MSERTAMCNAGSPPHSEVLLISPYPALVCIGKGDRELAEGWRQTGNIYCLEVVRSLGFSRGIVLGLLSDVRCTILSEMAEVVVTLKQTENTVTIAELKVEMAPL